MRVETLPGGKVIKTVTIDKVRSKKDALVTFELDGVKPTSTRVAVDVPACPPSSHPTY